MPRHSRRGRHTPAPKRRTCWAVHARVESDGDPYKLALGLMGLALIGATWLPHLLKQRVGCRSRSSTSRSGLLYPLPLPFPDPDPFEYGLETEHLTELVVLVALVGAGLRIDTPIGWRRWTPTWRLLGIAMPLCIVAGALLGHSCWAWAWLRRCCWARCSRRPIRCSPPTCRSAGPAKARKIRCVSR